MPKGDRRETPLPHTPRKCPKRRAQTSFRAKILELQMLDERPPERAASSRLILAMAARARLRAAKLVHVLGEIAEKNAAAEIAKRPSPAPLPPITAACASCAALASSAALVEELKKLPSPSAAKSPRPKSPTKGSTNNSRRLAVKRNSLALRPAVEAAIHSAVWRLSHYWRRRAKLRRHQALAPSPRGQLPLDRASPRVDHPLARSRRADHLLLPAR